EGAVAHAHGNRRLVAGQVTERLLGEVTLAPDPVHDLQRAVRVALEVGYELREVVRLPVQTGSVQGPQREGGVPHPAVAVVPVALSARRLGQRGGERSHRGPGRRVGKSLERE